MKILRSLVPAALVMSATIIAPLAAELHSASATTSPLANGTILVLDGQNAKIWSIPKGGGSYTQVADLSTLVDSCSETPYPWESVVFGHTMYWIDDSCGDVYATEIATGNTTDIYSAHNQSMRDSNYLTVDKTGNLWLQAGSGSATPNQVLELTAGTFTPYYYAITGGNTSDWAMSFYKGDIYFGSSGDGTNFIYKFTEPAVPGSLSTIAVTTVANTANNSSSGMAIDKAGNIFFSNYSEIDKIPVGSSTASIVNQTCATNGIESMKVWQGNLYFTAWRPGVVCELNSAETAATVLAANPDPTSGSGFNPEGIGMVGSSGLDSSTVKLRVSFGYGSSHVSYHGVAQLNWLKRQLKGATNVGITVTGYVQPNAGLKTDTAIGLARAQQVRAALKLLKVAATITVRNGGLKFPNVGSSRVAVVTATW